MLTWRKIWFTLLSVMNHDGRIIIAKVADLSQKGKMILSITGKLYIGFAQDDIKVSPYQFYERRSYKILRFN
jgi:hypothetical protein